jgi:TDG/mug DNA glycosylase family protein
LELTVTRGEAEGTWPGDDFPGRFFAGWQPEALAAVLEGAGFAEVEVGPGAGEWLVARGVRARTLPDTVGPGMRLLVCGLNPSLYAADAGIGFARPGNRFWPAALRAGLVTRARDPEHALVAHGIGLTDQAKRATVRAEELTVAEYRAGLERLTRLVAWLRPGVVCVVGLAGWRAVVDRRAAAGVQPDGLAGVPVYLMPNPSGLNAHTDVPGLAAHLRAAAELVEPPRPAATRRSAAAPARPGT